jgi:hypothetical protein
MIDRRLDKKILYEESRIYYLFNPSASSSSETHYEMYELVMVPTHHMRHTGMQWDSDYITNTLLPMTAITALIDDNMKKGAIMACFGRVSNE